MKRREFITFIAGVAVARPFPLAAQQPKLPRIGVLLTANPEPFWTEFRAGLREHGYIEGQNIAFEFRSADGKLNLLRALADELVRLKVDIIVASQTPTVIAARQATSEIPTVMAPAGDAARHASGGASGSHLRIRHKPVRRHSGCGSVAQCGDLSNQCA